MGLLQLLVLALVQGITEFLPISSSAHLVLVPAVSGWADQGLVMDVAVHVGTLLAVMIYFWRDVLGLVSAVPGLVPGRNGPVREPDFHARMLRAIILATVPIVIAGFFFVEMGWTDLLRRVDVIALASIGFGLLLYWADMHCPAVRPLHQLSLREGLIIGLFQVLALIPGTSRSGITMTAGRLMGFSRTEAARFSMLLSIPTILAAGTLAAKDLIEAGVAADTRAALLAGGMAFVAAILAIHGLMRWLTRQTMTPFVVYRVVLGLGLLVWVWI